ncbi:MAG: hypothetical protein RIQ81_337 [Pseudomonadota bacterium]|jgi:hypothetical protein
MIKDAFKRILPAGVPVSYVTALALWAVAEANFWFVAPDFLLVPLAIFFPSQWFRIALTGWGASVAGGALYFALVSAGPTTAESILGHTPFVIPRMHEFVRSLYTSHGPWGGLAQSWSFMTLKVWTYEAVRAGFDFLPYYLIVSFSRIFRLFVVTWIAARLSRWVLPVWSKYPKITWVIYTAGFLAMLVVMEG